MYHNFHIQCNRKQLPDQQSVCNLLCGCLPKLFRMAPDQYDADINIEGFRIWKIKIADQSFGMDILGTEQEILSLFHNMCHVIIRAIAAVTDIDIFYSIQNIVPVNSSSLVMRKPEC